MQSVTPISELDAFASGALTERFALEIARVAGNIYDPNTRADATRSITINFSIKPTKNRRSAAVTIKVTSKLAPVVDLDTSVQIGIDQQTGELIMVEDSDQVPGQVNMDGEVHEENVARFPLTQIK